MRQPGTAATYTAARSLRAAVSVLMFSRRVARHFRVRCALAPISRLQRREVGAANLASNTMRPRTR